MTKQEVLQKFASAVDVAALRADFPDIEWVITELDDGQQEIIIRVQGDDPDYRPTADLAAIASLERADVPGSIKNAITLKKHKRKLHIARLKRRDNAWLKRINQMRIDMGLDVHRCIKLIQSKIPVEESE